jgi:hypothetical protein
VKNAAAETFCEVLENDPSGSGDSNRSDTFAETAGSYTVHCTS